MEFESAGPSVVKSIKQRDLLNTWLRLFARNQSIPRMAEYQPARIEDELPDMVIYTVDTHTEPPRLTIQSDGTRMSAAYGNTGKGRYLDEYLGARLAPLTAPLVQCVAGDHDFLTITMDSWPASLYEAAKGRLFSLASHISVERDREYRSWPKLLDDAGLLDGKKIGIIRQDIAEQAETTEDGLKPGLADLGYEVAAEAVLPCPEGSQTCEQQQVAIQRMQDAGVDFVFLVAQTLAGSATVEAGHFNAICQSTTYL